MTRTHTTIDSPIGPMTLVNEDGVLRGLYMMTLDAEYDVNQFGERRSQPFGRVIEELSQYFAGERRTFDVSFAPTGNAFQRLVWKALCEIPYGETWSYGYLAQRIGKPGAARAVGAVNGQNPISILIPCHRVIGANGKLIGYAGGLARKEFLLNLENPAVAATTQALQLFA
jgi:methylated-DNA-[protein]-cysteine S-methyltransferase